MSHEPHCAAREGPPRWPVTVVTGPLGSAKTTLLNHVGPGRHGLQIGVIVNEIGESGIDSELIIAAGDEMVELSNGCICCSINDDLVDAVFRALEREDRIDHLVVESTGLADPLPIVLTFLQPTSFKPFSEQLPDDVFRAKGMLWVAERSAIRVSPCRQEVHAG